MIAYLLLVHDQPRHAGRLARRLAAPDARVFVHVDAKADAGPFRAALGGVPGVTVLDRRVAVSWGGYSVVRATLALAHAARQSGPFTRYALLSGSDYVLTDAARRAAVLLDPTAEYVSFEADLGGPDPRPAAPPAPGVPLTLPPPLADAARKHARARGFWRRYHFHDTPFYSALVRAGYALPRRRFPGGLAPWKGAQWWALTDAALGWIFAYLAAHPAYARFHRWTHAPDEYFFHSLLAASPFVRNVRRIGPEPVPGAPAPPVRALHYQGWWRDDGPPPVLTLADLPALRASGALFGRKVREGPSDTLLDALDAVTAGG